MPLDGLHVVEDRVHTRTLDDILVSLGIEVIPWLALDKHKRAEIARHPASFFYRHPDMHNLFMAISLLTVCASLVAGVAMTPINGTVGGALFGVTILSFICATYLFGRQLKGNAQWVEFDHPLSLLPQMPQPVMELARRVYAEDQTVGFAVGTLIQAKVTLDPYLVVRRFNRDTRQIERACLGIWDGDKVIRLAKG